MIIQDWYAQLLAHFGRAGTVSDMSIKPSDIWERLKDTTLAAKLYAMEPAKWITDDEFIKLGVGMDLSWKAAVCTLYYTIQLIKANFEQFPGSMVVDLEELPFAGDDIEANIRISGDDLLRVINTLRRRTEI